MFCLDEGAYLPQQYIEQILSAKRTGGAVIFMSNIVRRSSGCFLNELMGKKKQDGTPLFSLIDLSNICEKCRESGDPEKIDSCNHCPENQEIYRDLNNMEFLRTVFSNNKDAFIEQVYGFKVDGTNRCVPKYLTDRLIKLDRLPLPKYTPYVLLGIDPASGGDKTAFVAVCVGDNDEMTWTKYSNSNLMVSIYVYILVFLFLLSINIRW
jgi:hypothetical protein